MLGWKKHKLESRLLGEVSITSDMQMTPPFGRKWKKKKKSLDESERGEWKSGVKTEHSKNWDHGIWSRQFSSVQSLSHVPSLWPHESQHIRPPCLSPTPKAYSNSCPSSRWCHPAISSSAVPFSSCSQSLTASGSFPISQLFAWGGQSTGVLASASVLPMNTQDWSPLG